MDEREVSTSNFRGGTGDNYLLREQLFEHIANVLDIASYKRLPLQSLSPTIHRRYFDNEAFWKDAITDRQFESMRVQLKGFHITEWIPLTPGRYFTSLAQYEREIARQWYNPVKREYTLDGKAAMFLGGIGSVRFTAKTIASETIYFLGASSNGVSHQGIPIALRQPEYHQVIQIIKEHGGCFANIVGTLQVLPMLFSLTRYDRQVPKHCLVIDDVEIIYPSESSQLSATISATFQLDKRTLKNAWTFNTFHPGPSDHTLDMAVDRLQTYIKRYSHMTDPVILSDFDEQYPHFANTIEFPISQVFKGNINSDQIHRYESCYHVKLEIKEVFMGDKVEGNKPTYNYSIGDISNATVSGIVQGENNTVISNLNASGKNELAQVLKTLTDAITSSKDLPDSQKEDQVKIVNQIGEEAAKPKPNKPLLKILGDGLLTTLKAIPDIASAVAAAVPLLTQLHL